MTRKSQLEVVNFAAASARDPRPQTPESNVRDAAVRGAVVGAVLSGGVAAVGLQLQGNESLDFYSKAKLVASKAVAGAAAGSAMNAHDQYGIEKQERLASRIAKNVVLATAAYSAADEVLVGSKYPAKKLRWRLYEYPKYPSKTGTALFRFGSYLDRAEAHERRADARSSRSARSAILHRERAAELRALAFGRETCVESLREHLRAPRVVPTHVPEDELVADYEDEKESGETV